MTIGDIITIACVILGILIIALYFLNRWASRKMGDQEEMMERSKQTTTIYVIDKKKMKAKDATLPKAVMDNLPKIYKFLKIPFVKVKIGPQIMTLMCDKKVFQVLPIKKNVKVEIAGIYILSMVGMKTDKQMKEIKQQKLAKATEGKKPWYKFFSK